MLTVPNGSLSSIAQIVAQMHSWQDRNIRRARGGVPLRPEHLDDTFPMPGAGDREALRTVFLDGLKVCAQVAREKGNNVSDDRADSTAGYDLAICPALHSAYHSGQIAMLRQILGLWPPLGGDDSW